ncbi:hypothetical protein [Stenomitos frigidus]|nr:hypothetical protein [Stenomitos frigidus]
MSLTAYIRSLAYPASPTEDTLYLKEFDLFQEFPVLQHDVDYTDFFPGA